MEAWWSQQPWEAAHKIMTCREACELQETSVTAWGGGQSLEGDSECQQDNWQLLQQMFHPSGAGHWRKALRICIIYILLGKIEKENPEWTKKLLELTKMTMVKFVLCRQEDRN